MSIEFPRKLLKEQNHDWNILGTTTSAGQSTVAPVMVRSDGGGFWSASINNIQFYDQTDALLWRAIRQICNGGVTPIVVWRNDRIFSPFPVGSNPDEIISHSDGSLFSDSSSYYQSIIDVTCAGGAALRSTAMTINLNYCGTLIGGESFSIEHPTFGWRLYEIGTVVVADDGLTAAITFNPPLREATPDQQVLEFDRPRCLMRLADSTSMDLNVTTWPFSTPSVKFLESKYA
jgi:hypothetical protein